MFFFLDKQYYLGFKVDCKESSYPWVKNMDTVSRRSMRQQKWWWRGYERRVSSMTHRTLLPSAHLDLPAASKTTSHSPTSYNPEFRTLEQHKNSSHWSRTVIGILWIVIDWTLRKKLADHLLRAIACRTELLISWKKPTGQMGSVLRRFFSLFCSSQPILSFRSSPWTPSEWNPVACRFPSSTQNAHTQILISQRPYIFGKIVRV
jgi:hypothetical protein